MPLLSSLINAADKSVGAEGGDDGHDKKPEASAVLVHFRDLLLLLLALKESRVSAKLENEVRDVGSQQHECGTARKKEQVRGRLRLCDGGLEPRGGRLAIRLGSMVLMSAASYTHC